MDELLESVRALCAAADWSRAVEMSRAGSVVVERRLADEQVLRLVMPGGRRGPAVTLWPAERSWDCECGSSADACVHVAAVILARQATDSGPALIAAATATATVGYDF